MTTKYKASLDTLSKIITAGVFVLMIALGQKHVRSIIHAHGNMTHLLLHAGSLFLIVAIIIVCYLYSTNRYILTATELIINRPIGNRVINISDITEIRVVDPPAFRGTIRTFGNGGLFGYYGKFYNTTLGHMTWYVTQRRNRIFILTNQEKKIVISPDDLSLVENVKIKVFEH